MENPFHTLIPRRLPYRKTFGLAIFPLDKAPGMRINPVRLMEYEPSIRPPRSGRVSLIFGGLILVVAALNLWWPRRFAFFAFDHHSYLPAAIQVGWALLALGLVAVGGWAAARPAPRAVRWLVAFLLLVSLPVFRTAFPAMHGDGEGGGSPRGDRVSLASYPEMDGRLQSVLAAEFSVLVPDHWRFTYHFCGLFQDFRKNNVWILLTLLVGAVVVLLVTATVGRLAISGPAQIGLQITALCAPPMLNAYGHFDSYMVPVACVYAWFVALCALRQRFTWVRALGLLPPILLAAFWSHPVLLLLSAYTAALGALGWLGKRWAVAGSAVVPVLAGCAVGLSPFLLGLGNWDLFTPELAELRGALLHEKVMSGLQVGLPAFALAAASAVAGRRRWRRPGPWAALAILMLTATPLLFFTLWVGYGVRDEFVYALHGAVLLGAALLLYLESGAGAGTVLGAAVLSLYLFLPRAYVYSNERMLERFRHDMLRDRSGAARHFSPYYLLASNWPLETEAFRAQRLAMLKEGAEQPLPMWDRIDYRGTCHAHYTAWCLELGRLEEGRARLEWMLDHEPRALHYFWRGDGRPFNTDRFVNVAPRRSRDICRALLAERRSADPDNPVWRPLELDLARAEEFDPVIRYGPRPGTRESDIPPDLWRRWREANEECQRAERR
jgi:hypothetical protein